ncbi:protein Star-like [Panulirus ornatus]|uniref:protein Star-like n=1 Tax=Panulirus ornatus TaxID=150431 RepID=UPI003A88C72C
MGLVKGACVLVGVVMVAPALVFYFLLCLQVPSASQWDVKARLSGPLAGDDPRVVRTVRENFLDPPSSLPYNLTNHAWFSLGKNMFTWPWVYYHIHSLFSQERGGFFVEAGALDGEYLSNTLWLEQELGWTGLLIEAEENNYKSLRSKHRRAWSSSTCLSSESYPKEIIFVSHFSRVKLLEISPWSFRSHGHELRDDLSQDAHNLLDDTAYTSVQCFPLVTYLAALNVSKVDLLSLDIQGTEASVLTNFFLTLSDVSVRVIVVENEYKNFDDAFMRLMSDKGYILLAAAIDYVFVKGDDPVLRRPEVVRIMEEKVASSSSSFLTLTSSPSPT